MQIRNKRNQVRKNIDREENQAKPEQKNKNSERATLDLGIRERQTKANDGRRRIFFYRS